MQCIYVEISSHTRLASYGMGTPLLQMWLTCKLDILLDVYLVGKIKREIVICGSDIVFYKYFCWIQ